MMASINPQRMQTAHRRTRERVSCPETLSYILRALQRRRLFEAIDASFDRNQPFVLSGRKNHHVRELLERATR
jgi:hypothetical protein